jgi:hypothetical protein
VNSQVAQRLPLSAGCPDATPERAATIRELDRHLWLVLARGDSGPRYKRRSLVGELMREQMKRPKACAHKKSESTTIVTPWLLGAVCAKCFNAAGAEALVDETFCCDCCHGMVEAVEFVAARADAMLVVVFRLCNACRRESALPTALL